MFRKYCEQRLAGRLNVDLLVKLHQQLCMYRVLVPEFYRGPLLCFQDLQRAIAALREPKVPARKKPNQALVPAPLPEAVTLNNPTLPIAHCASGSWDCN